MSYADVTSSINTMKSQTNATNYEKNKANTDNEMNQDMFLQLMITQLQNQDPLEPMDNTEFLSQQAMFTQVNTLQEMNQNLATYGDAILSLNASMLNSNTLNQAMNLVGKEVTAINPDNKDETISGIVDSVKITDNGLTFTINGQEISSEYITGVNNITNETTDPDAELKANAKDFLSDILQNPKLKSAADNLINNLAGSLL